MPKFSSRKDKGYERVLGEIRRWKKAAMKAKDTLNTLQGNDTTDAPSNVQNMDHSTMTIGDVQSQRGPVLQGMITNTSIS